MGMSLELPSASVTVEEDGLGIAPSPVTSVHVVMGCCSKGPTDLKPISFGNIKSLTAGRGCGPAVKAAAYSMAKTEASVVFTRLPATARAATKSAVNITGLSTASLAPSVSGTPKDSYEVKVLFTLGGTTGTGPITYKYSLDGGVTYSDPVSLGVGLTIGTAFTAATGLTITLVTAKSITTDDYFTFSTTAASATVLPLTSTVDGDTDSVTTITGTPEDAYEVRFEILKSGTIGTAGIKFRYSLDGGRSFTKALNLGTDDTYELLDGKTESTGLTVNFAAGDVTIGDVHEFKTTAPEAQDSDIVLALEELRKSSLTWSFIHVVGQSDATTGGSVGTTLADFSTKSKYTFAALSARGRYDNEPDETWRSRLVDDVDGFVDPRIAIGAGMARITCPVTARRNRRPIMWVVVPRLLSRPIEQDPGRVATGALSSDVELYDDDNLLVEHDARLESDLHGARYVTLRTYEDETGIFVTRGNLFGDEASKFTRIALRRVMDVGSSVARRAGNHQIENGVKVNGPTKPNPGCIREADALKIEREMLSALNDALTNQGRVSSVSVQIIRTNNLLTNGEKVNSKVRITPLGYIDFFEVDIGFENPALSAVQAA